MRGVKGLVAEMAAMRQQIDALGRRVAELEAENAALRTENTTLRIENSTLRKALEESRRAGKRQAAPFSRGKRQRSPDGSLEAPMARRQAVNRRRRSTGRSQWTAP